MTALHWAALAGIGAMLAFLGLVAAVLVLLLNARNQPGGSDDGSDDDEL